MMCKGLRVIVVGICLLKREWEDSRARKGGHMVWVSFLKWNVPNDHGAVS